LLAADSGTTPNTINVNAISGQVERTTIIGGANRTNTLNIGNGDLVNVSGTLDIQLSAAGGTINFNDQAATTARTYALTATTLTSPPTTFTGAGAVNFNAGSAADSISINGSAAGTALVVHGNGGNDTISVGGGNFDSMLSAVSVFGDAGVSDTVRFRDQSDPDFFTARLNISSFVTGVLTHSYSTFENVQIFAGDGGSDVTIAAVPFLAAPAVSTTTVFGGGDDDRITIGVGNVGVRGNVLIDGSFHHNDDDTLVLNDSTGTSDSSYTFDQGNRFYKGSPAFVVTPSDVERTILQANGGDNTVTVESFAYPLTIQSNAGNDRVIVLDSGPAVTVQTGSENVSTTAPFGDSIEINTDFAIPGDVRATVLIDQDDTVLGLTVAQAGTLRIAGGAVLEKAAGTGNNFTVNGTIDVAGGALLSRASAAAPNFRALLTSGFAAGVWNGTSSSGAINSSFAANSIANDGVGHGLGSEIAPTSISSFAIAPGDIVLRYTLNGDANLDQLVNLADFNRLAANFGQANRAWTSGDWTYDGIANLTDFNALAGNFGSSAGPQIFSGQLINRDREKIGASLEDLL
jgi:hypothetical protein